MTCRAQGQLGWLPGGSAGLAFSHKVSEPLGHLFTAVRQKCATEAHLSALGTPLCVTTLMRFTCVQYAAVCVGTTQTKAAETQPPAASVRGRGRPLPGSAGTALGPAESADSPTHPSAFPPGVSLLPHCQRLPPSLLEEGVGGGQP